MVVQEIKSQDGSRILGRIVDEGYKLRATDPIGNTLGYYDKSKDYTTDKYFQIIARGDVLASLIYNRG